MHAPESNYVLAKDIPQGKGPTAHAADVWLGRSNELDSDGLKYTTLEIQPAYGNIAAIRLSLTELREISNMLLKRLNANPVPNTTPVQVIVAEGTAVEISYT